MVFKEYPTPMFIADQCAMGMYDLAPEWDRIYWLEIPIENHDEAALFIRGA